MNILLAIAAMVSGPVSAVPGPVRPAVVPADPLGKVRCVKEQVTGSLMETRKICHTERDWLRIDSAGQDEARRLTAPTFQHSGN